MSKWHHIQHIAICVEIPVSPVPIYCNTLSILLDWSKLKQIADDILSAFKMDNKCHVGGKDCEKRRNRL